MKTGLAVVFLCCSLWLPLQAQSQDWPIDEVSSAAIRAATTDPMFLTEWVATLPDHPTVPSPRKFLGYSIGAPGELTQVEEIHGYFRALAESSDNIRIFSLGMSDEGREVIVAAIADAETLAQLETYKDRLKALADARVTDAQQAAEIINQAKPIYWLTAGLHSPELGPPEMVMELAYRLIVENREPFANIRNKVITLITPVLEVDGRARQVDWYHSVVKGHKNYADMPPTSVPFWGKYMYHDNNRDGITASQPLTRSYLDGFFEWMPTLGLDLHESVPLLYVAGGTGPYNPNVSAITAHEWQLLANYEISRATGLGLKGVWTWGFYTGWYPGYILWVTNNHNSTGRFYETFGNGTAETVERDLKGAMYAGKEVLTKQWYRANPPPRKFQWSMRNNTNYMQTGALASLEMVANNSRMFLENFYKKAVAGLSAGIEKPPYVYLIPQVQRDAASTNYLVEILQRQRIELQVAERNGNYGDIEVREGDLLVKLDQPYGALAKNLLEKQKFPKEAELPPYDDVAWTLGLMLGVEVKELNDRAALAHSTSAFSGEESFLVKNRAPRGGRFWVIANHGQRELGPLRFALGDMPVLATEESFSIDKTEYPAGSFIFDLERIDLRQLEQALAATHLQAASLNRLPEIPTHELDLPRLAVLQSWTSTQNAGWVRYSLDTAGVPYQLISQERLREGNLREDFDAILMPSLGGFANLSQIIGGFDKKWSPLPYKTTAATPNLGHILSSEDITGGFGFDGMAALEAFIRAGGTFVALGSAGITVTDSGIVRKINSSGAGAINTPGSIVTAQVTDRRSPLVYGYQDTTYVFRGNGPIYQVSDQDRHLVALQFGTKDVTKTAEEIAAEPPPTTPKPPLVQSGGIVSGEGMLDGGPALLSVALGQGHVVLFSWNPMHRHLNHHDHGFVYNALLHWNDLPDTQAMAAD